MSTSPVNLLPHIADKPIIRALGLMTGTSMDGLDMALVKVQGDSSLNAESEWIGSVPFPEALRSEIQHALNGSTEDTARLNYALGKWMAETVVQTLKQHNLPKPDCAGVHGQTLFHDGGVCTLQVGEPAFLANRLQVPVVSNFRAMDIAVGGQGAPLIPKVDEWLFREKSETRVTLNLGGVANVTILPPSEAITGFDTGPGMALLDEVYRLEKGSGFDREGAVAMTGSVNQSFVDSWLNDDYIQSQPPKSTGRDRYGQGWIRDHASELDALSFPDRLATLSRFTGEAVSRSVKRFAPNCARVIVSGSGIHNQRVFRELEELLAPTVVQSSADFGVDPDGKEAIGFAMLAVAALKGVPANIPSVTGAEEEVRLGTITFP